MKPGVYTRSSRSSLISWNNALYSIESADKFRPRLQKEYCNRKFLEKREKFLLLLSYLAILSSIVPSDNIFRLMLASLYLWKCPIRYSQYISLRTER